MTHRDRTAYMAAYDAARKEKRAAQYQEHREERRAHRAVYYGAHKEEEAAYRKAHKEHSAIYHAAWYEIHKEEQAVIGAAWTRANPENVRARASRRRVKLKVNMDKLDRALSADYRKAIANDPCFYCGGPGEEDDHYVSLANGGTDHWWNLVRACFKCNRGPSGKFAMNGDEFLARKRR